MTMSQIAEAEGGPSSVSQPEGAQANTSPSAHGEEENDAIPGTSRVHDSYYM